MEEKVEIIRVTEDELRIVLSPIVDSIRSENSRANYSAVILLCLNAALFFYAKDLFSISCLWVSSLFAIFGFVQSISQKSPSLEKLIADIGASGTVQHIQLPTAAGRSSVEE